MLDELDRKILQVVQSDATPALEDIAKRVNSSKTPVWNRIKKMRERGVISREVAIVDPDAVGLDHCFFILVKTSRHDSEWLESFTQAVAEAPEIMEAHRLTGEIDYILKVRVRNVNHFDEFYKRLVAKISIYNVTSCLSMEAMKETTALAL